MDALDILKLAGQYGVAGILALVLGFVMYKVGMHLVAAIKAQTARIDAHTQSDVAALTALTVRIEHMEAHLETKLDGFVDRVEDWLDRTPVEGPPHPRHDRQHHERPQNLPPPRSAPGEYRIPRAASEPASGGVRRKP